MPSLCPGQGRAHIERNHERRMRGLLVGLLALAVLAGGCVTIGGDEDLEATEQDQQEDPDPVEEESEGNATDVEAEEETVLEEETISFEGAGTGVGTWVTASNFWIVGNGIVTDVTVPETHEGGTLTFDWEGTESFGGMWVWVRSADQTTVHIFEIDSPPFEEEFEPDDERLQDAEEIAVIPNQGMPATAHVEVEWAGEITLDVPVET